MKVIRDVLELQCCVLGSIWEAPIFELQMLSLSGRVTGMDKLLNTKYK
jgi:hypothetical protein